MLVTGYSSHYGIVVCMAALRPYPNLPLQGKGLSRVVQSTRILGQDLMSLIGPLSFMPLVSWKWAAKRSFMPEDVRESEPEMSQVFVHFP